jgi:DegV family protein with EDD domain
MFLGIKQFGKGEQTMKEVKIQKFYDSFINGAREVIHHRHHLNQINVFPVPDGDTGSNLTSLMYSIINHSEKQKSLKATMNSIANSAIIGARGNSGLIFAQYLQGFSEGISDGFSLGMSDLLIASEKAVLMAYSAIADPVEGTMLSSMKAFHVSLEENKTNENLHVVLERSLEDVRKSVNATRNQMPVLKKAGVEDSGAKGFMYFIKGFVDGIIGHFHLSEPEDISPVHFEHDEHFDSEYRYCTEALLETDQRVDLKSVLADYGDSLITAGSSSMTRIHLHTNHPAKVFNTLSSYGRFLEQKVDDMKHQSEMIHNRKYRTALVTDSIADIPSEYIDQEQIHVMNLGILIDDEPYIDKLTISNERLFELSELRNTHPKSSQPTLKQVQFLLEYLSNYYQEILVMTVSSKLSGTYNVIKKCSEKINIPIEVIDTRQNSIGQGILVHEAAEMIKSNASMKEIKDVMEKRVCQSKILVGVKTLDNMIASGRLSVKAGWLAKKIGMRPIITLKEGKGVLEKVAFGYEKTLSKMLEHTIKANREISILKYAITYVDDADRAEKFSKQVEEALGFGPCYIVKCSSIIAAGAGKGAVAIGYLQKEA